MKKIIYMIAFTTTLGLAATAQALVNNAELTNKLDTSWQNPGTQTTIGGGTTTVVNKLRCAPGFSYSPARYDSNGNEICTGTTTVITPDPVVPSDPVILDPVIRDPVVIPVVSTATVSSCPSGTTKSSDGCCCVNN